MSSDPTTPRRPVFLSRSVWNGPGPLLLVLVVRLTMLFFLFPSARHGLAPEQVSGAIGVVEGQGLSITWSEVQYVRERSSNLTLNLNDVYFPLFRRPLEIVLPLPSLVMAGVWTLCGTRSVLAYLLFMILAEIAVLAPFLGWVRKRLSNRTAWVLAALLAFNVLLGRAVVSITYDTYAYLGSVLAFYAGVLLLERRRAVAMFATAGLSALTILGRELNLLLYPLTAAFALWRAMRMRSGDLLKRAFVFFLPFALVLCFTTVYRYVTTGNARPTRSTFWHTLWAGVGQFQNPYGLTINDWTVATFARKIDPTLGSREYSDYSPDSRYETVLRKRAGELIRENPWLLVRNTFYRIGIILSPGFYTGGNALPQHYAVPAAVVSVLFTLTLAVGLIRLRTMAAAAFWMVLLTLLAEIVAFSWFYVVGRVVILSSHAYLLPIAALFERRRG